MINKNTTQIRFGLNHRMSSERYCKIEVSPLPGPNFFLTF